MMDVVAKYVEGCRDDLDAARTLLDAGKPFWVAFLCHQALFKLLRGYFLQTQNRYPPNEPLLPALARASGLDASLAEADLEFLYELSFYPQVISQSVYRQKIAERAADAASVLQKAADLADSIRARIP